MATTMPLGEEITVASVNLEADDRFVASLVSSYGNAMDGVTSVKQAAAAAYAMTLDHQSDGTMWSVLDRKTGLTSYITQSEFEELVLEPGYLT